MPYYPPASSGGSLNVQDEGVAQGAATTVNFTGAGVTATAAGGTATVNIPGGAGAGAQGTAILDFGTAPGKSSTSVAVTGQTSITGTSKVSVWLMADTTAQHNAEEHTLVASRMGIVAGSLIAGTGFTIYADTELRLTGTFKVYWSWV